ncbi:MAG: hypothetical protein AAF968_04665 [Pseudomonadota bacterium]
MSAVRRFDEDGALIDVVQPDAFAGLSLAEAKSLRIREINDEWRRRAYAGVTVGGVTISTREAADAQLRNLVERLTAADQSDGNEVGTKMEGYVTEGGDDVDLNALSAEAARVAARDYFAECGLRERALVDLVRAAGDVAGVAAIDIQAGWPS